MDISPNPELGIKPKTLFTMPIGLQDSLKAILRSYTVSIRKTPEFSTKPG